MTALTVETGVSANDRLSFTVFVALALHALIVLTDFLHEDPTPAPFTMEITLSRFEDDKKPEKADFLADTNQLGSGTLAEKARVTSTIQSPHQNIPEQLASSPDQKNKQLELLQFKLESDNKLISNIRSELDRARIKTGESRELSATLVSGQQEILAQLQKNKNDFQASLEGRRYVLSSIKNSADHGIEIAQKNTNKKMQSTPKGAG